MKMKRIIAAVILLTVFLSAGKVFAEPVPYEIDAFKSTVKFRVHATFHGFTGTSHSVHGKAVFDSSTQQLIGKAEVFVPVNSIKTGIIPRDKAMYRMFEADHYPEIRFTLLKATASDPQHYRLKGTLKIREIEQPFSLEVETSAPQDQFMAEGEVPMTTTMFDLKPPAGPLGIRVRKDIVVQFSIRWKRQS